MANGQSRPGPLRPWREIELTLTASADHPHPYTGVDVWAEFVHSNQTLLRRPAFWDGGRTWRIRFASPFAGGEWRWRSAASVPDPDLSDQRGTIACAAEPQAGHRFYRSGFWRMSPGGRSLVHADGTPALLVADTAWALPWRATVDQCRVYADDRRRKGFNAALLMSVQPDMSAEGPRDRTQDLGFGVGFEDLRLGHINEIDVTYFQYFDRLVDVLVAHEIVPVHQPVFHGYGWRGGPVAGLVVPTEEYVRYCRYLVARYGSRPALYLVGADGPGRLEQIDAAGREIERWDCYRQPTGLHYAPNADNCAWQDREWLDFQWCQTGHNGEHVQERVADMRRNTPVKAVANGEPTYENMAWRGNAAGWWQGHEAWSNLCAGGTMGVVYGAASLWQWRLHENEPGHAAWCSALDSGWRDALAFEGSSYVGVISRIFDGLPFADMEPNWTSTHGRRAVAVPGKLLVVFLPDGGYFSIVDETVPREYRVVDPKTGAVLRSGDRCDLPQGGLELPRGEPLIVIFTRGEHDGARPE